MNSTCVSRRRFTTSEWKLLRFGKMKVNDSEILLINFYLVENWCLCNVLTIFFLYIYIIGTGSKGLICIPFTMRNDAHSRSIIFQKWVIPLGKTSAVPMTSKYPEMSRRDQTIMQSRPGSPVDPGKIGLQTTSFEVFQLWFGGTCAISLQSCSHFDGCHYRKIARTR